MERLGRVIHGRGKRREIWVVVLVWLDCWRDALCNGDLFRRSKIDIETAHAYDDLLEDFLGEHGALLAAKKPDIAELVIVIVVIIVAVGGGDFPRMEDVARQMLVMAGGIGPKLTVVSLFHARQ